MIVHKGRVGVWCGLWGVALVAGLSGSPARAQEPKQPAPAAAEAAPAELATVQLSAAVEPGLSRFLGSQRDELGRACEPRQVAALRDLRFVACGTAGLWVMRGTGGEYKLLSSQDVGGAADSFFIHDGHLWVELTTRRAVDVGVGEAALPPGTKAIFVSPYRPPPSAAMAARLPNDRRVHVVEKRDDGVIVEASSPDVLEDGERIAFYPDKKDQSASLRQLSLRTPPFAIGQVRRVAGTRARVSLGLNETVPLGAAGEPTSTETTDSRFAPPRAAGVWHLAAMVRPLVVLDDLGAGVFADLRVGYRFELPVHVEAIFAPVAFASARPGLSVPIGGFVKASFDTRFFEVGLGVGGQTVNDPGFALERGTGTLLAQHLRIGAADGGHIEAFSYVVLFHSDFSFSSIRVQGQIPVGSRFWLVAAGGGGSLGLGYGEAGLRTLLWGNGLAGSFFLTATIGGVHVFEGCNVVKQDCRQPSGDDPGTIIGYTGPMVGVGGEWRL